MEFTFQVMIRIESPGVPGLAGASAIGNRVESVERQTIAVPEIFSKTGLNRVIAVGASSQTESASAFQPQLV